MARMRHRIRPISRGELTPQLSFELGRIMHDAVWEAPWKYHGWPLGTIDSEAHAGTAVGYIRLCDKFGGHFLVLEAEHEETRVFRPVGVWAGTPLAPELVDTLHLTDGIDAGAVRAAFGEDELPQVTSGDYYHLIIAIDGPTGANDRPLENHRSTDMNGMKAAEVMMRYMNRALANAGVRRLWTKTHPAQQKMIALFDRLGFHRIGCHYFEHGAGAGASRDIFLCTLDSLIHASLARHLKTDWI